MTVHEDDVGGRLAEAMMLLEMAYDGGVVFPVHDLIAASLSLVQAARGAYVGAPVEVSQQALALMSALHTAAIIDQAQERRK